MGALMQTNTFVEHIKTHLRPGQKVLCTICGKTIDDIVSEALEERIMIVRNTARNHFTSQIPCLGDTKTLSILDETLDILCNYMADPIRAARGCLKQSQCTVCQQALEELEI